MERGLGVRLFRRTPAGMLPTAAGERLRGLAQDLANRHERLDAVMQEVGRGQQSFTVACPETTGNFFIAPYIAAGAPISNIVPARPAEVYQRLETGVDMAVNTSSPPPHLRSRKLISSPILLHYPGTAPFAVHGGCAELREVVRFGMQIPGHGSAVDREVRAAASAADLDLSRATRTGNGVVAQAQAAAGRGTSIAMEPAAFGLNQAHLVHDGAALAVDIHAAWDPEHYAAGDLAQLAEGLAGWMARATTGPCPAPAD